MRLLPTRLLFLGLLTASLAASCGDEPQRTTRQEAAQAKSTRFAGEVRLLGDLIGLDQGVFFVSIKSADQPFPILSKRYTVPGEGYETTEDAAYLRFDLDETNTMIPGAEVVLPERLELKVSYAPTGFVESIRKDATLLEPVQAGQTDLSFVLRPEPPAEGDDSAHPGPTSRPVR